MRIPSKNFGPLKQPGLHRSSCRCDRYGESPKRHYAARRSAGGRERRGAAAVEFALICPLFILLLFGMIEFGRMAMVQQVIINASREGARQAVVEGNSVEDVKDIVEAYMTAAHIPVDRDNIDISAEPDTVDAGDPITVSVGVSYDSVSWLPGAMYLGGSQLTASAVMRKEGIH